MALDARTPARPDGMKHRMQKLATLFGAETRSPLHPSLCGESRRGKCFEGTLGLRGKSGCSAVKMCERMESCLSRRKEL